MAYKVKRNKISASEIRWYRRGVFDAQVGNDLFVRDKEGNLVYQDKKLRNKK